MAANQPPNNAADGAAKQSAKTDIDKTAVDPVAQERLRAAGMADPDRTVVDPVAQARLRAAETAVDDDKTIVDPVAQSRLAAGDERTVVEPVERTLRMGASDEERRTLIGESAPAARESTAAGSSPLGGLTGAYAPLPPAENPLPPEPKPALICPLSPLLI